MLEIATCQINPGALNLPIMAYDYDRLYSCEKNALGETSAKIVEFFNRYSMQNARILDIGCGQGRDAIFLARLGHKLIAVDISPAGIADLVADSSKENLGITGVVADIVTYEPDGIFDIILIDRTLHMLAQNDRLMVLRRLIPHIAKAGHLLIADEKSNMAAFKAELEKCTRSWRAIEDKGGILFIALDGQA